MSARKLGWGGASLFLGCVATVVGLTVALEVSGERRRRSASIGAPAKGKLVNGARLPDKGPGFYSNPARPNEEAVYGSDEMIATLIGVGEDLEKQVPGIKLFINDIGFAEGGIIPHHRSHQSGRDVDLLFFARDGAGKVSQPVCVPFDDQGKATWDLGTPTKADDDVALTFDARLNWLVVKALIESSSSRIQRIFVSEGVRTLLLEHAEDVDEPAWIRERAGDVMCEPGAPHDDHFHVRLFCTAEDYHLGCRDVWPLYPWRRTELAKIGLLEPRLSIPRPRRRRGRQKAKATTPRKTPGRLWCP